MKKLFIAAVLGLDAMYRFWEKLKDVRESVLGDKHNDLDEQATIENKELRSKKLLKSSSIFSGNKVDFSNENEIVNMFEKYGQVLIYPQTVEKVWEGTAIDHTKHDFGFFMSIKADDFNNSVKILIAKAWKSDTPEEHCKYIDVLSINHYKDFQHALDEIKYIIGCYSNITLLLIPDGVGKEFAQALNNNGIGFESIYWDGNCFSENDNENYVNKRSQAFVDLSRAVHTNRLKIKTQHFMDEIKEQLVSLHYDLDYRARFKVLTNKEMMKSPNSLGIAELLAYMFLNDVNHKLVGDGEEQQEKIDVKNMSFIDYCKEIRGDTEFYDTETVCRELSQKGSNLSLTFAGFYYSQMTHVAKDDFTYRDRGFTSKGISILALFAVWSLLCEDASKIYLFTEKCAESSKFLKGYIESHKRKLKQNGYQYLADQIIIDEDRIYIDGYKDTRFICVKNPKNEQNLDGLDLGNVTIWYDVPYQVQIIDNTEYIDSNRTDYDALRSLGVYAHRDNVRVIMTNRPYAKLYKMSCRWFEYTFNAENIDGPYTQFIKNELKRYGSRNHPDYLYFIRGIFPDTETQE
ncbi:hypothetical protein [Acinetobacter sp. CFCC 10889]|uniref:hypothetical protein n=1 Tax=Acinetobacter sp. CFCC 10889 TaxID=1775557 RepID=UPI0013A6E575|nr:hypothetical protein [Acinetobacter sp. CFCC 10889]